MQRLLSTHGRILSRMEGERMREIRKGDEISLDGKVIGIDRESEEALIQTKSGDKLRIAFEDVKTVHPSREARE